MVTVPCIALWQDRPPMSAYTTPLATKPTCVAHPIACSDCQELLCARKLVHVAMMRDIWATSEHFTRNLGQRHHRHAGDND